MSDDHTASTPLQIEGERQAPERERLKQLRQFAEGWQSRSPK